MAPVNAWVTTLPEEVKVFSGTTRFYVKSVPASATTTEALASNGLDTYCSRARREHPSGAVVGAIRFEVSDVYHHLLDLSAPERAMYEAWKSWFGIPLTGQMYRFRVLKAVQLASPIGMRHTGSTRCRGFVTDLSGEADAVIDICPQWLQRNVPNVALRLLPAHAVLVSAGCWVNMWIPDIQHIHQLSYWRINWSKLGLRPSSLPVLPAFVSDASVCEAVPGLTPAVLQQVADQLRRIGAADDRGTLAIVDLQAVCELVTSVQKYVDESTSAGVVRHLKVIIIVLLFPVYFFSK